MDARGDMLSIAREMPERAAGIPRHLARATACTIPLPRNLHGVQGVPFFLLVGDLRLP
jgi:hypothetical protein